MINLPSLETNITYYCQNTCIGCNHMIPAIKKPYHVDIEVIRRDIEAVKQICHTQEFSVVGGEPTLHPQVAEIIQMVKESGISDTVITYTNGQSMDHLPDEYYKWLDRLIVDPYKIDEMRKQFIADKCNEFNLPLEWHTTTFRSQFLRDRRDQSYADRLYRTCWYRFNRSAIDEGYFHRCCSSQFITQFILGKDRTADAIAIDGLTEEKLNEYLNPADTPEVCYFCCGNSGVAMEWRECAREDWLKESAR